MSGEGADELADREGLCASARREWRYLRRSRWDLTVLFALPLLTLLLLAWMFGTSLLQRIPVAVVDHDQSALSRQLVQTLQADPKLSLRELADSDARGGELLRTAQVMAVMSLPAGLERDVVRGQSGPVGIGYNAAFQTAASQAAAAMNSDAEAVLRAFAAAHSPLAGLSALRHAGPRIQVSQIGNSQTSFERFLEPLVAAGILHLLLSCSVVAAVGRELKEGRFLRWGRPGFGFMLRRLLGKIAPPTLIYAGWFAVIPWWLHGVLGWPIAGHLWPWLLAQWALCAATAGIGALLVAAARDIDTAFSVSTIYAGSAITYSNGTLPVLHASWFTRWWSQCLPFTHYLKVQNQQFGMGSDASVSLAPVGVLLLMAIGSLGLAAALWAHAVRRGRDVAEEVRRCGPSPDEHRWYAGFVTTLSSIARDRSMLSLCVLSVLLYGFYYPQAYRSQVSVKLPVVVVDQDHDTISRSIVRALDATRAVQVEQVTGDLEQAQKRLRNGEVDGLLYIAPHLEATVLTGRSGGLAIEVPATYLVRARDVGGAINAAVSAVVARQLEPLRLAGHRHAGVVVQEVPMYNPADGYGGYVVPAVAAIILHQTLLFGTAMLVALRREQSRRWSMRAGAWFGCWLALTTVGCLTAGFYFGFVYWFQDFPRMGNPMALLLAVPLFAGTVAALGLALGSYFERSDRALQVMAGLSVLLFFLGGVSWPLFAMPQPLAWLARGLPSTVGMQLFVQLNSAGASLHEVRGLLGALVLQLLVCLGWAGWRLLPRARQRHREASGKTQLSAAGHAG
ncbi:ABC transporter permease [Frateuria aurantia]